MPAVSPFDRHAAPDYPFAHGRRRANLPVDGHHRPQGAKQFLAPLLIVRMRLGQMAPWKRIAAIRRQEFSR